MGEYHLTKLAQRDLRNALQRSALQFGLAQALSYEAALRGALETLAEAPNPGTPAGDGRLRLRSGEHWIYDRLPRVPGPAFVVRILHRAQLPKRHLKA